MSNEVAALVAQLSETELFGGIGEALLPQVARVFTRQSVRAGTVVFEQATPVASVYVVARGGVELRRRDIATGMDYLVASYGELKSFGEENALGDDMSPLYAVATAECDLLLISRTNFVSLMQQIPSVGLAASRIIARRANRLFADKGVKFGALAKLNIDRALWSSVPRRLIVEARVLPLGRRGATVLAAMTNPFDSNAIDEARRAFGGANVEVVAVSEAEFDRYVTRYVLPALDGVVEAAADAHLIPKLPTKAYQMKFTQEGNENISEEERKAQVTGEQVVAMLNQIIGDGLALECSDIHIEPYETDCQVRYRIEGKLLRRPDPIPMRYHGAVVSRLKALASMNITERRKPQDGRLGCVFNEREISLRISSVPTRFGEKVVMRVLDRSASLIGLDRIIGLPRVRDIVRSLIFQPHGIVLITGPTGSGKTTTMYSAILERRGEGININTVEDPIEYTIPGITQVQYNDAVDLGYAQAIKAFLRQDTDVMLIGETRDARTAGYAIQAALSGHLVLTSLHTNSALSTIYRLKDMGIESFLLGNAIGGVVAQRLVRKICTDCRQAHNYPASLLSRVFDAGEPVPPLYRGAGCSRCNNTGYRGRAAVVEVMRMNEELRAAIAANAPMTELKEVAIAAGMVTFRDYCRELLVQGVTTPSEVSHILYAEDEATAKGEVKVCGNCGAANTATTKYCEDCGSSLS